MSVWVKDDFNCFVTHAKDNGGWGEIRFNTYRVDKKNGNKKVRSYFSFWKLAGSAYEGFDKLVDAVENAPTFEGSDKKKGVLVKIKSWSVSQEPWIDDAGERKFLKQPRFNVWDWEFVNSRDEGGREGMDTPPQQVESAPEPEEQEDDGMWTDDGDEDEDIFND